MDISIADNIMSWRHPWLDTIMIAVTNFGGPVSLAVISLVIIILYYQRGKIREPRLWLIVYFGGWVLVESLKRIIMRSRPTGGVITVSGYSFPSAHAAMATMFFLLLIYFHQPHTRSYLKSGVLIILSVLAVLSVGFSRIYLGAHWPSDVLGGYAIGSAWVLIAVIADRRFAGKGGQTKKAETSKN